MRKLKTTNLELLLVVDDFMQTTMVRAIVEIEWEEPKRKKKSTPPQSLLPALSPSADAASLSLSS